MPEWQELPELVVVIILIARWNNIKKNICTRREWKAGEISVQRLLLCISPHRRSICTGGSCLQPQAFSSTAQLCADSNNAQLCNVLRTFLERHGTVGVRVYTVEREREVTA